MFDKDTAWVIDAEHTTDKFPPFVFFQYDIDEHKILARFVVTDDPPGWIVGIVHDDGIEPADKFHARHLEKLQLLIGDAMLALPKEEQPLNVKRQEL